MLKLIFVSLISIFLISCSSKVIEYKEVYIPAKCDIPQREKPLRSAFDDYTEFQAHLRAYYKNIESDLYFCRTGQKENLEK